MAEGIANSRSVGPRSATPFVQTLFELTDAFDPAHDDPRWGDRADRRRPRRLSVRAGTSDWGDDGYLGDDDVAKAGIGRLNVLDLQIEIR